MPRRRYTSNGDPALKTPARLRLRAAVKAEGLPCARCGQDIDYTLKGPHPWSYVLGEIIPRWIGGSAEDPTNVQPEHLRCGAQDGARITNAKRRAKNPTVRPATADRW